MPAPTTSCPSCSAELPAAAQFCLDCGTRVAPRPGSVSWNLAEPRYFGVLPGRRLARSAKVRLVRIAAVMLGRLRLMREAAAAYSLAQTELFRLRREAAGLNAERHRIVYELGAAVYRDDAQEIQQAKARHAELDERLAAAESRMKEAQKRMHDRIRQAQLEGGSTEAVELPPNVPEPEPVPHEPPGPVIVPEPEPVPHEPPAPVIVPEPEPPRDAS